MIFRPRHHLHGGPQRPSGTLRRAWRWFQNSGRGGPLVIAVLFCVGAASVLMLRQDVMPYRPGQYVRDAIHARVDFAFKDKDLLIQAQEEARQAEPRIYSSNADVWNGIAQGLRDLPESIGDKTLAELPSPLREVLDGSSLAALKQYQPAERRGSWHRAVDNYVQSLRRLVILNDQHRQEELKLEAPHQAGSRTIQLQGIGPVAVDSTLGIGATDQITQKLLAAAGEYLREDLQKQVVALTLTKLKPTHVLDEDATQEAQNRAARQVPQSRGQFTYKTNQIIKESGKLDDRDWYLLRAEHEAYLWSLDRWTLLKAKLGTAATAVIISVMLAVYTVRYQPRVLRNHARGLAIAALLLSMLLLAQLAAIGTGPLYVFGVAPTILVAMIMAIAYDRRLALGVASFHALLVTVALNQGVGFLLILEAGVFTCCWLMDDLRARSRLIEVGGGAALAMMAATGAVGMMMLDPVEPLPFIGTSCIYVGAAGLSAGFIVLGILPFIEKAFRITTSMTLLELADASHPLLRRLALEAPGTYSHSLQVAMLAEAAAEAIGANSLLCRVGSYYHDVGKLRKADYFCENQSDGQNRHLNLSANVSLRIILGHVNDGIQLAREYNLPTSLMAFIQQHHGTTLVEYFYHQACTQESPGAVVAESQFRYGGPRPRSRETAVVMLCDAVESACRTLSEVSCSSVGELVRSIVMKRLLDGQLNDCELTMRELEQVEQALVRTLVGIHHGRVRYPGLASTPAVQTA